MRAHHAVVHARLVVGARDRAGAAVGLDDCRDRATAQRGDRGRVPRRRDRVGQHAGDAPAGHGRRRHAVAAALRAHRDDSRDLGRRDHRDSVRVVRARHCVDGGEGERGAVRGFPSDPAGRSGQPWPVGALDADWLRVDLPRLHGAAARAGGVGDGRRARTRRRDADGDGGLEAGTPGAAASARGASATGPSRRDTGRRRPARLADRFPISRRWRRHRSTRSWLHRRLRCRLRPHPGPASPPHPRPSQRPSAARDQRRRPARVPEGGLSWTASSPRSSIFF